MSEKPHRGVISNWRLENLAGEQVAIGLLESHPEFKGRACHTSKIVERRGSEIETMNSRYTLGEPLTQVDPKPEHKEMYLRERERAEAFRRAFISAEQFLRGGHPADAQITIREALDRDNTGQLK